MRPNNDTNVPGIPFKSLKLPILLYHVAFGVDYLGIMDPNYVELHNLHHQVIYFKASIGEWKVKSITTTCFFFILFPKQISKLVTHQSFAKS
jgi:molybdopterin/thiamine biosynthesis adenylyltransferase